MTWLLGGSRLAPGRLLAGSWLLAGWLPDCWPVAGRLLPSFRLAAGWRSAGHLEAPRLDPDCAPILEASIPKNINFTKQNDYFSRGQNKNLGRAATQAWPWMGKKDSLGSKSITFT